MKFKKFGKALVMSAFSAGVLLGVTSCVQSYTVGYLYVTGTVTSQSNGNGIISGFKIDHNTGKLTSINGLPVASGGSNPVRAVLINSNRFLYVLNRGVSSNPAGSAECTTEYPCAGSNITQFAVGANGILTPQETFTNVGVNPMRMIVDGSGSYIYVLDNDAPDSASYTGVTPTGSNSCMNALGSSAATSCGAITAFQINSSTGRLQVIVDSQVTAANGSLVPYFPIPSNPIDFVLNTSSVLTLYGTPATGDAVFPYTYSSVNGQLTTSLNSADILQGVFNATAIVNGGSNVYVLDNDPITVTSNGTTTVSQSQILPFTVSGSTLEAAPSGVIADYPTLSTPMYLLVGQPGNKWLYVANYGNGAQNQPQSGIAGYTLNGSNPVSPLAGSPFSTGSGPVCFVEDPSNQFYYTANFIDSTVTGQLVNEESGGLQPLSQTTKAPNSYKLNGPPTWCLVDGRVG